MHTRILLPLSIIILVTLACGTSSPADLATPTSLFEGRPSPEASALTSVLPEPGTVLPASTLPPLSPTLASEPQFTLAVIVDTATQHVTREQALYVVSEASKFLNEFSPIGLVMTDYVEDSSAADAAAIVDEQLAARYVANHANSLPNGLLIFTRLRGTGACGGPIGACSAPALGWTTAAPQEFRNPFVSPTGARNLLYVVAANYDFKYKACGYGGTDTLQSTVAVNGECRGQPGLACVQGNGYSMCPDAVRELYTNTPTHFISSMVVYRLLSNFVAKGQPYSYSIPECNTRMGYPAGFFDLQESEYYNDLCPYVYEDFTKSYQP